MLLQVNIFASLYCYWVIHELSQIILWFCVSVMGRLRDLQYIFGVTSGPLSISMGQGCPLHHASVTYCSHGGWGKPSPSTSAASQRKTPKRGQRLIPGVLELWLYVMYCICTLLLFKIYLLNWTTAAIAFSLTSPGKCTFCLAQVFRIEIGCIHGTYCLSKKSWPISYGKLLYKLGQDFLDILYVMYSILDGWKQRYS